MAARTKRGRRGRPAGKPLTRRELAARRRNLKKARAAPKELVYRPTDKRVKASLKNLRKALAWRRQAEASDRIRLNALKHGFFSRELVDESVKRLGEDRHEFARHRELFVQFFVPRTEEEAVIVWELGNLAWRRLRLFRAAAERERRDLRVAIERYGEPGPLAAAETLERMYLLLATLDNWDRVLKDVARLRDEIQQLAMMLVEGREKVSGAGCQVSEEDSEAEDDPDPQMTPIAQMEIEEPQGDGAIFDVAELPEEEKAQE